MNTATRDTEGRREIEAVKQRLASAKSHASFVSTTFVTAKAAEEKAQVSVMTAKANVDKAKSALDSARKMADTTVSNLKTSKKTREDVQSQLQRSNKEVEDAEKFLADAEKRWEVIDVDESDTQQKTSSKNKKRKVSTSPQGNNNAASAGQQNAAAAVDLTNDNNIAEAEAVASLEGINKIIVQGLDRYLSYMNGSYNRTPVMYNGAQLYIQHLNGTDLAIYRRSFGTTGSSFCWAIGYWHGYVPSGSSVGYPGRVYYTSLNKITGNDWVGSDRGESSLTCRLISDASIANRLANIIAQLNSTNEIVIANKNKKDDKINGTYKRSGTRGGLPSFARRGSYRGKSEKFVLYHDKLHSQGSCQSSWIIGIPSVPRRLYQSKMLDEEMTLPPKSGWRNAGIELQY